MKSSNHDFEMYVLVGHKPIKEYSHEGSTFVEGRDGSEYTIRVRNGTSARACFILSVDGLSVLDGKECSDTSPGYVIDAGDMLDVLCYKVDGSTGAKFVFGNKEESYSAQIGKGTDNVGVIAARVFREKPKPHYSVHPGWSYPDVSWPQKRTFRNIGHAGLMASSSSIMRRMSSGATAASASSATRGVECSASSRNMAPEVRNMVGTNDAADGCFGSLGGNTDHDSFDMEQTKLGTKFGEAVNWKTEAVTFERSSVYPDASLVMYYDNRKNLERRGVKIRKEIAALPNPFPGNNGCVTPPGWRK